VNFSVIKNENTKELHKSILSNWIAKKWEDKDVNNDFLDSANKHENSVVASDFRGAISTVGN